MQAALWRLHALTDAQQYAACVRSGCSNAGARAKVVLTMTQTCPGPMPLIKTLTSHIASSARTARSIWHRTASALPRALPRPPLALRLRRLQMPPLLQHRALQPWRPHCRVLLRRSCCCWKLQCPRRLRVLPQLQHALRCVHAMLAKAHRAHHARRQLQWAAQSQKLHPASAPATPRGTEHSPPVIPAQAQDVSLRGCW